jgi:hypothetical protein
MELAWGSQAMGCHTLSILIIIAIFGNILLNKIYDKYQKSGYHDLNDSSQRKETAIFLKALLLHFNLD